MIAAKVALLLMLLPLCVFSPGFFFVRKLRWSPLEKLCGSVGLSLVLLYGICFGIYCLSPPGDRGDLVWKIACWAVSALCLILGVVVIREVYKLASCHQVRRVVAGFAFLLAWTLAILSMIRHYSGGGWTGDWLEHFQRTLFFLHRFPKATPIFPDFQLPARPPLMNLLAAFFLGQTADRFELFQVAFLFLNLLVFLPCCLIAPSLAKGARRPILPLVALFALNPMVMQNATYTWTKLLTAFYVVLGIWFYLAGWRKSANSRLAAAFLALAAGALVHYSAGPYLVFVAAHYLLVLFRQRQDKWRELATVTAVSGGLLATWFAWSIASYGPRATFASNTTLSIAQALHSKEEFARIIAGNVFSTVVPHPLHRGVRMDGFAQHNAAGQLRDYVFLIYQTNVILAMGAMGGPVALYWLYRIFWRDRRAPGARRRRFWLTLVPCSVVLGIAVQPWNDLFGVAHVTLQPLVVLGLSLLAGSFASLPRLARRAILAGCVVDFALGVFLSAKVQNLENGPDQTIFAGVTVEKGHLIVGAPQERSLSPTAWGNWFQKHRLSACREWIQKLSPHTGLGPEYIRSRLGECGGQDELYWKGWYARNGGSLVFLGDWTAGWSIAGFGLPATSVILAFLGLIGALGHLTTSPPKLHSGSRAP